MKVKTNTFAVGVLCALVGAGLWGLSGACIQFLTIGYSVPPSLVTAIRIPCAAVAFVIVLLVSKRTEVKRMLSSGKTILAVSLFALGLFGSQFTYACSVQCTNAGTATVFQMLNAAFVMLYICLRHKQLPHVREVFGLALAIGSTVLIATQGNLGVLQIPLDGLFWGIVNGMAVALYVIVPKELGLFDRFGSFAVAGVGIVISNIPAMAVCIAQASSGVDMLASLAALDAFAWLVLIFGTALLGTFLAFSLYIHGVSVVGSVKGSLLGAMEPVSACVCAALWLGTAFTAYDLVGMVLMIVMVALVSK